MSLIDRHIFIRFAANFALLFSLLFVFAVAVDLIINLDKFVDAAREMTGPEAGLIRFSGALIMLAANFQAPRVFQFYAYLHGLVAIGAMGFTLAQMHRYRELVAVMASGVSLYRVAVPFFVGIFGLSVIQLLNQELILPRVAPLLLRGYSNIGEEGIDSFEVRFTPDDRGSLFQSASFNPRREIMDWPTIIERDERGRTSRRITARQAAWSESQKSWILTDGVAIRPRSQDEASPSDISHKEVVTAYPTDLTPHTLLVRRYNQFAAMLSSKQIFEMLHTPYVNERDTTHRDTLLRYQYSRLSSIVVNLLVMALALPCFLLREPASLLRQSVLCASLTIPATIGSAIGTMVQLPGIPPAVGVFLPAVVLMFFSIFPWTFFKT